jgi:hypothetical protein
MTETERYAVLAAHPEGGRLVGSTNSLQVAVERASESPRYEIYDYVLHEFVALPVAAQPTGDPR